MGTIVLTNPTAGDEIEVGLFATNYTKLQSLLNGNLTEDNLAANGVTRTDLATVTRKQILTPYGATVSPFTPSVWPDAAVNLFYVRFIVPDDYVSGNITWKTLLRAPVSSGTAKIFRSIFRYRDGTAVTTVDSGVTQYFVSASTNTVLFSGSIASSSFQAGDEMRIEWQRNGADADDTLAGGVIYDGGWIEYTGRS